MRARAASETSLPGIPRHLDLFWFGVAALCRCCVCVRSSEIVAGFFVGEWLSVKTSSRCLSPSLTLRALCRRIRCVVEHQFDGIASTMASGWNNDVSPVHIN